MTVEERAMDAIVRTGSVRTTPDQHRELFAQIANQIREAVLEEREANAVLIETWQPNKLQADKHEALDKLQRRAYAAAIRERGTDEA